VLLSAIRSMVIAACVFAVFAVILGVIGSIIDGAASSIVRFLYLIDRLYLSCAHQSSDRNTFDHKLSISRLATLSYAAMSRQARSGVLISRMSTSSSLPCVPWRTAITIVSALATVILASSTMEIQRWSVLSVRSEEYS
jgi:hypothetical protein